MFNKNLSCSKIYSFVRSHYLRRYRYVRRKIRNFFGAIFNFYYARTHNKNPCILFIGDSHTRVFDLLKKRKLFKNYLIEVIWVGGATAQGIVNPNSKTNALKIFKEKIKRSQYKAVFIQLGEVDCGFVTWYRAEKYNETVDSQLKRSLKNYFSFVEWLHKNICKKIVLTGAVLPTIKDGVCWGEVPNARKDVKVSQYERTKLTLKYNADLRKMADIYEYIDITDNILNKKTGLVDDFYLHKDVTDNHLSSKKTIQFWEDKILNILNNETKGHISPS